jgi:hypothetical protein
MPSQPLRMLYKNKLYQLTRLLRYIKKMLVYLPTSEYESIFRLISYDPKNKKTAILLFYPYQKRESRIGGFFPDHNVYILLKPFHKKHIFKALLKNDVDLLIWEKRGKIPRCLKKSSKVQWIHGGILKWSVLNSVLGQDLSVIYQQDIGLRLKHQCTAEEVAQAHQSIILMRKMQSDMDETMQSDPFAHFEHTNTLLPHYKIYALIKKLFLIGGRELYNQKIDFSHPAPQDLKKTSILLVGRAETSSLASRTEKAIVRLACQAKKDFPYAKLYYWRYPRLKKRNKINDKNLRKMGVQVLKNTPLSIVLSHIDRVYSLSSFVGFEALLLGIPVTVFEDCFYSGRGLTEDREAARTIIAKQALSLEALFFAIYIKYSDYLHPFAREKTSFSHLLSYAYTEKLKFRDIFAIPETMWDPSITQTNTQLGVPLRLLAYLRTTNGPAGANLAEVLKIGAEAFSRQHFAQFTHLLIATCNYDILIDYCNFNLSYLHKNINSVINYPIYSESFFYYLAICLKNTNGRVIAKLTNYTNALLPHLVDDRSPPKIEHPQLLLNYMRCLSYNIQYDDLEAFLTKILNLDGLNHQFLQKIGNILAQKPSRSDRNPAMRFELLHKVASKYKLLLTENFTSTSDVFINNALYHMLIDDEKNVIHAYECYLKVSKKNSSTAQVSKFFSFNLGKYVVNREEHLFSIAKYLLKKGHFKLVTQMHKHLKTIISEPLHTGFYLEYLLSNGDYLQYMVKYNQLSSGEKGEQKKLLGLATALRNMGEFERARDILTFHRKRIMTPEKRIAIENEINKLDFIIRSSQILHSYPQPKLPKGVIFIASQTCFNTMAMLIPCLREAKKMGYAVVNLMQGMLGHMNTGIECIDRFANAIPATFYKPKLQQTWYVHWAEKIVSVEDINFYQGFYERLSTTHRSYFVNLNYPLIHQDFQIQLKRADVSLTVCKDIYQEIVARGIPVAFISSNSHVTPFSIFRDFCRHHDHAKMSFINANIAYENYFSNLGSKYAHTMGVTDMTLHKNLRAPFLARQDMFEIWYEKNKNNEQYLSCADQLIRINRNSSQDNSSEKKLTHYLEEQKQRGKKIVCCFGKIPIDLCVPYDGGYAHEDMADWLNHTISICMRSEDLILLIKPHPHELRPEIALDLIEGFTDLIHVEINSNIKILGHRDINVYALAPYLDLAILWNGSSSLELTSMGVPVIMCSYFGKHDYPVELIYPQSREQYEKYLLDAIFNAPDDETRKRAAFLISYLGTSEISIRNEYATRQATNDKIGVPKWQEDKIKQLLEKGDIHMRTAAARIVEKFEGANVD